MNQTEFFKRYHISKKDFESTGLVWKKLEEIFDHFSAYRHIYEPAAKDIVERLVTLKTVHSVRYRIKDSEHLIAKIIRKKIEDPIREYTLENYFEKVDDIIGVRALHLYKSDWEEIGDFIENTWGLKEKPTANIRKGDAEEIQKIYTEKGYVIKEHKYGYRSIHYIIESSPTKTKFTSELQVRTIFEEGWSEIDHNIRYPYDLENPILNGYLNMFNRLAGNADEMGTYIKFLQKELTGISDNNKNSIKERDEIIKDLKSKVEKLKGASSLKKEISTEIDKLFANENTLTISKGLSDILGTTISPNYLNTSGSVFLNPSDSVFLTSGATTINNRIFYSKKCDQCGTLENDPFKATANVSVFGYQFHTCQTCKRYLCNNCWPHYNPLSILTTVALKTSSLTLGGQTSKCPKCVKEGK